MPRSPFQLRTLVITSQVAAALWACPVEGQDVVFRPYQRIRVTASALGHYGLVGRLLDVGRGGLRVRGTNLDYELVIPLSMLDSFEVSRGKNRLLTIGFPLLGLGLGAALGPALITEDDRCRVVGNAEPECAKETADALVGGVAGFGIFAIGSQILIPERWREVTVTELSGHAPGAAGLGGPTMKLGVQLRF